MSELTREKLRAAQEILLPDRYQDEFKEAYQAITGREVPTMNERKSAITSTGIIFRFPRGRDIPALVSAVSKGDPGYPVAGLTGSEWCEEYLASKGLNIQFLPIGKKMGAVALLDKPGDFAECSNVVTGFPGMTPLLSQRAGRQLRVAQAVNGRVEEIADRLGLPAIDLVCSGESAKEYGFTVTELLDVFPAMVVPADSGARLQMQQCLLVTSDKC